MPIAKIIDSKTIHVFDKAQFDWYAIRNSGQIFVDPQCEIITENDKIVIKATENKSIAWLWNFFDLETDYNNIKQELIQFKALHEPMKVGAGIRILRQDFKECAISFIISANNNIKRFSKTLAQIDFNNLDKYTEEDFKSMGCGYRSPYLVKAIKQLESIPPPDKKALMAISGVGPKVADCILLFAYHRLDVAPVDTHIARAIEQLGKEKSDVILKSKYGGVAQQYIFYWMQHLKKNLN